MTEKQSYYRQNHLSNRATYKEKEPIYRYANTSLESYALFCVTHCECGAYLTFAFNGPCKSLCKLRLVSVGKILLGTVSQGKFLPKFRKIL